MQTMSREALAERAARIQGVSKAICCECLSETFTVYCFGDGTYGIGCAECPAVWTPAGEGSGIFACVPEAVGEGGDEPENVVPPKSKFRQAIEAAAEMTQGERDILFGKGKRL